MNTKPQAILAAAALVVMAVAACSKKPSTSAPSGQPAAVAPASQASTHTLATPDASTRAKDITAGSPGSPVEAPAAAAVQQAPAPDLPPATLTDVNLVAADMGGAVEGITGFFGPGLTGRRLIDGLLGPAWAVPVDWNPNAMYYEPAWVKYPEDIVLSFFERTPALVGAVGLVLPESKTLQVEDETTGPREVEIWTAMDSAPERYFKAASATLEAKAGEQTVAFPATDARFIKVRVRSGASRRVLELSEIRVYEASREGYVPLFTRAPGVKQWKGSPREAAQRGLDWLQQSSRDWTGGNCFGCHVHAQVLMGQAVAERQGYRVSRPAMLWLANHTRENQLPEGTFLGNHENTAAAFGAMGLAYADEIVGNSRDPVLQKAIDYLVAAQGTDGAIPGDNDEPPVMQGQFSLTANALESFEWAAAHSSDPRYRKAADRAIAWISSSDPVTTQDRVFKIFTLNRYGTAEQKRTAWTVVEELADQQQRDGGWKESDSVDGSNAFATGQVLYAFKQAGISTSTPMFQRGVGYLLKTQVIDSSTAGGSWTAVHTQSQRKSDFAPTMWAVIGLAGAYGKDPMGALQIVKQGDKSAGRNLEIVLDVSGSMKTTLGAGTRWQTALDVLKEVVATLPEDLNVGLRVYGHRYPSKSAETCQDTELVVPIANLDRGRIVDTASQLAPRGETPLVTSVLKTVEDLKAVGGGSVILITDGEESCHGDARAAARKIKASGVKLTLNIVGFTLTGKAAQAELSTFAGSTGGQYYGAQDGQKLSRAVKMAALQRLPYDVVDATTGRLVVSGETSELSRTLPPGDYRVHLEALGQKIDEPFSVVPDQTTTIAAGIEGDRFVLRH